MARPLRYPVAVRGNARQAIFRDEADREHFVRVLGLGSGAAVSLQLRRLAGELPSNHQLCTRVSRILAALAEQQAGKP